MRNQMVAIILMMFLVWGWFAFFMPSQPPLVEEGAPGDAATAPAPTTQNLAGQALRTRVPTDFVEGDSDWPSLPPIPVAVNSSADEVLISDDSLVLTFTRIGGRLKRVEVLIEGETGDSIQLVPEVPDLADTDAIYPLGLRFSDDRIADELDFRRFDVTLDPNGKGVTFSLSLPGAAEIRKTFRLRDASRVLDIDIEYENRETTSRAHGLDVTPAYILNWGPGMVVRGEGTYFPPEFVWRKDLEQHIFSPEDLPLENGVPVDKRIPDIEWMGYKSKYFIVALKPNNGEQVEDGWALGSENAFRFGLYTPKFEVRPTEVHRSSFQLYVGPMHLTELGAAWETLPAALRFFKPDGWFGKSVNNGMDWFAKILLRNLNWWYGFIPNYGVAIVLLTVLVRMVMFPLTLKSMRSMKKMQTLQPEMEALREQYKDDQQELSKAMMEMYKERGINPVAGCFPMLLQMPVFIALYRMLWNAFELRGAPFLWMEDLSQTDRLFRIPFTDGLTLFGGALQWFNILPILVAVAMVASMKMTPTGPTQNPQQKMMMRIMPVMFGFISYGFSAGLNLYVLTSTVLGIMQSRLIRVTDIAGPKVVDTPPASEDAGAPTGTDKPKPKPKPKQTKPSRDGRKKKPQHFYDRAQQRKREIAKAGRKKSRKK